MTDRERVNALLDEVARMQRERKEMEQWIAYLQEELGWPDIWGDADAA